MASCTCSVSAKHNGVRFFFRGRIDSFVFYYVSVPCARSRVYQPPVDSVELPSNFRVGQRLLFYRTPQAVYLVAAPTTFDSDCVTKR